jgi:hypothetical protein
MYKLNKGNPIVKKLMELDDAISEYFAQKHCNPQNCASNGDISRIVGPEFIRSWKNNPLRYGSCRG